MQTDLPRLFTDKGELIADVDTSTFSAEAVARLDVIRRAYSAVQDQERAVADCQSEITAALAAVEIAAKIVAPFGKYDFHRLWRENFGGGPRNRMMGR